ncbi:MAG: tetratricopeptide repeat protein [Anaerolineales bacterium]|nr:tetratricopeptide repeat protein [Anaerolineales bacterium]
MKTRFYMLISVVLLSALACTLTGNLPVNVPGATPTPNPAPTSTATPAPTATLPPTPTPPPGERIASGDHALLNGDWQKALQEYEIARDASSEAGIHSAALLGIGRANLMGRNYYEAIDALQGLIDAHPEAPELAHAYFFMGQAYDAQELYWEAADSYLNYAALRPGLIDAYVLELRADALFAAGDYAGAATDYQAALLSPSTLDNIQLQMKLARAYTVSGDQPTALALYDDLYHLTNNDNTRALIDLRKGQAYTALEQIDLAHAAYMDAITNYPAAYESYLALIELVDAGVEVNELQRGIVDYFAGQYGMALSAFENYLQSNPTDAASAHYYYGLATRALGGHEEAIGRWDKVIQNYSDSPYWDDAWEQKAYTQWAFLEEYPQAVITLIDFVDSAPAHPRAAEFLFDAALVAERAQQLEQAAELWQRLASNYPNYDQVPRGLFLAGITYYRLADYQNALTSFQRFQSLITSLEDRSAAYFWIGKTQNAMGDAETALATWEIAAGVDPTGYYSERARDMIHNRPPFASPLGYDLMFVEQAERARAETWLRSTFGLAADTDLSSPGLLANEPNLQRGAELWKLGLYDQARAEFEQLRRSVAPDAANSYRLMNYLVELGVYRSAILAARQVLDLALMDDATTLNAPAYFNYVRFGAYYADLTIPLANEYGFHPLFLFSLARQESLFDSYVRSSADARGLMQIIPTTGSDIAKNLDWPQGYISEDLFRPTVNLQFGVDYLDAQRKTFDGNLYAALAAYNGGPGNARDWYHNAPDDPDVFLEIIRYVETRNYIRGVYEIFNIYRLIYDRTP